MIESDIHYLATQAKMGSISEEFSAECCDFDYLAASCLGGMVLKRGCFSFTGRFSIL